MTFQFWVWPGWVVVTITPSHKMTVAEEANEKGMPPKRAHVTRNAVSEINLARKSFRFSKNVWVEEEKANLHRGEGGSAFVGS